MSKNQIYIQKRNLGRGLKIINLSRKTKVCPKIKNLFNNQRFVQETKFYRKITIFPKIKILSKNQKIVQKSKICQ